METRASPTSEPPLACGRCTYSTARWLLRRDAGEVGPPGLGPVALLGVLYFAFGIGWGLLASRLAGDTRGWLIVVGLLVATGTSLAVAFVFRHFSRAEVE